MLGVLFPDISRVIVCIAVVLDQGIGRAGGVDTGHAQEPVISEAASGSAGQGHGARRGPGEVVQSDHARTHAHGREPPGRVVGIGPGQTVRTGERGGLSVGLPGIGIRPVEGAVIHGFRELAAQGVVGEGSGGQAVILF